jgi:antitoxin YefM
LTCLPNNVRYELRYRSQVPTEDIRPLSEFRANAAAFVSQVKETKRPLILTQHGRSAAVFLDVAEYESLVEQVESLRDLRQAESELAQGKGIEHGAAKYKVMARMRR